MSTRCLPAETPGAQGLAGFPRGPPSTLPSTQFFAPIPETPAIAAKVFEISENAWGYDISPDEVKESYLEGEDLNENAVVLEDIAWAERYGKNFDWKIFAIERDTPAQVTAPPLFNTLR